MTKPKSNFYAPGLMDLSPYNFVRADLNNEWDAFIEASPQGTIFARSEFLNSLRSTPGLWYCFKKNKIKAGLVIMETKDGSSTCLHNLMIYGGVIFSPHDSNQNYSQILSEEFRISSASILHLTKTYKKIFMVTHPAFGDLRPFLWHNYNKSESMINFDLRYTSYVNLNGEIDLNKLEESQIYMAANKSRRQEIRYGLKKGVLTEQKYDPELFDLFYKMTFKRQGKGPEHNLAELRNLLDNLHSHEMLRMYISRVKNGTPGSIAIFGIDSKRAYFLYGANDPIMRDEHTGTMVIWDAFQALYHEGVAEIDMEGVNSPARGYFKLSFGGSLKPYYNLALKQKV